MRLFDLILLIMVLWALLFVARHQFPSYEGKSYAPAPALTSPSSSPTS